MPQRVNISTRCMTCKYFTEKGTFKLKGETCLESYGICDVWCHKVFGSEYCSRGKYDKDWIDK